MYEGVRLAEILDKSCMRHWLWIPGQLNPADWITRTTLSAQDMGAGSLYQTGLAWMSKDRDAWPVRDSFSTQDSRGQESIHAVFALSASASTRPDVHTTLPTLRSWKLTLRTSQ